MRGWTFTGVTCALAIGLIASGGIASAQRSGTFLGSAGDPPISYATGPFNNVIDRLNARLDAGTATLTYDGRSGFLRSALDAIGLPVDSQLLVFSKGSLQGRQISQTNPRAIFFNDNVQLGWVRDSNLIEVAAQDATKGVVFYTLDQRQTEKPRFKRETLCLGCHQTGDTLGIAGLLMFSTTPATADSSGSTLFLDHSMPMPRRFAGWFVTGSINPQLHKGNAVPALDGRPRSLASTDGLFDHDGYPSHSSDIAALMVFAHQVQTVNALIRAGWQSRVWDPARYPPPTAGGESSVIPLLRGLADDVVDNLLFVDEAPLESRVQGTSGFAERFSAEGPRDARGRSLRQLDLTQRLMRYPCSYLIYSPVFDELPGHLKTFVWERMWRVLSGQESDPRYRRALTLADRRAIVEILRATKPDLPAYFTRVTN